MRGVIGSTHYHRVALDISHMNIYSGWDIYNDKIVFPIARGACLDWRWSS